MPNVFFTIGSYWGYHFPNAKDAVLIRSVMMDSLKILDTFNVTIFTLNFSCPSILSTEGTLPTEAS